MSLASLAALGLRGLVGVAMAAEGVLKLTGVHGPEGFEQFGYPSWLHGVVGALELLGGAALLVGLAAGHRVSLAGGLLVTGVLVGAVVSHLRVGDSVGETAPAVVLLVLAILVLVVDSPVVIR